MRTPLALCLLLLAAGCGSGSHPSALPSASPTAAACPVASTAPFTWPAGVPADVPQPPTSVVQSTTRSADGVTVVKLHTSISLQQSVLFVIREVQNAGYTLGRGDAEPTEADAPFGKGNVRGLYKMVAVDRCVTDWLVAVAPGQLTGSAPLLPRVSPGPSGSPLPFG